MNICMHVCVPVAHGNQERVTDILELALQMAVSCYVGVRNQTLSLCKSSKCSNC